MNRYAKPTMRMILGILLFFGIAGPASAEIVGVLQDGGFELGSPNPWWEESPDTPICSLGTCGIGALAGTWSAVFGGAWGGSSSADHLASRCGTRVSAIRVGCMGQ